MGMILSYGSYSHAANEAEVRISRDTQFSEDGLPSMVTHRWDITGRIHADDQTALITAVAALHAAYTSHGGDLYLKYEDGTTFHYLLNADTVGGTRVVSGPSYPEGSGAEASTYRTYAVTVVGEVATEDAGVIAWNETISWSGGGPAYAFLQTITGVPQKQMVAQSTPYEAEQSGSAVGFGSYPNIPYPIWPNDLEFQPRIQRGSPRRRGRTGARQFVEYPISWSYKFKSINPFGTVNPTLPP